MKGFKDTTRMQSGHHFPSSGTQEIRTYVRKTPKRSKPEFAEGGHIKVEKNVKAGNALTQRADPVTALDKARGGTSPLAPGFAKGGKPFSKKPLIGR